MNRMKSILEEWEILEFTGLPDTFPKCRISSIFSTEYSEFTKCLGADFYKKVKECLINYDCTNYDNEKAYVKDDTVAWNGVIKIALQDTTGNIPDHSTYWGLAPKFSCKCIEMIWCTFLGEFIAWSVVRMNLPFMFRQFGANGLVKKLGPKFEGVDIKDFHTMQAAVMREIEQSFSNLDHYMTNNNEDGCFDDYKGNQKGCGCHCGCEDPKCNCEEDCIEIKESGYGYEVG